MKVFCLISFILCTVGAVAGTPDSVPFGEYLAELRASGQLAPFLKVVRAQVAGRLPTPLQPAIFQQIDRFENGDFDHAERFLTLPEPVQLGHFIETSRLLFGTQSGKVPQIAVPVSGRIEDKFVRPCRANYVPLSPISPHLPNLGYGHFADRKLDACVYEDSAAIADVLTGLAAGNGSSIEYRGRRFESATAFIEALLRAGHRLTVRDERMYADFLSLGKLDGTEGYVRLPVWVQTGLRIKGESVVVPVGHSQHTWILSGPDVNVRFAFFLGMDGVGFFPQRSRRPLWTGRGYGFVRTADGWDDNAEYLLATIEGAAVYQRDIIRQSETVAKGLPAQGYGYLGVCNDSNAFQRTYTASFFPVGPWQYPFPLLRSAQLDGNPATALDRVFASVPRDTVSHTRGDLLKCRLLGSYPHKMAGNGFDPVLSRQMGELFRQLRRHGHDPRACLLSPP